MRRLCFEESLSDASPRVSVRNKAPSNRFWLALRFPDFLTKTAPRHLRLRLPAQADLLLRQNKPTGGELINLAAAGYGANIDPGTEPIPSHLILLPRDQVQGPLADCAGYIWCGFPTVILFLEHFRLTSFCTLDLNWPASSPLGSLEREKGATDPTCTSSCTSCCRLDADSTVQATKATRPRAV